MKNIYLKIINIKKTILDCIGSNFKAKLTNQPIFSQLNEKKLAIITYIENYTGYKWETILDSMFIGSISLILLKLIYRIAIGENPIWYMNLTFFIIGFILQIKYNIILLKLREDFVILWKNLLGWHYYGMYKPDIAEYFNGTAVTCPDIEGGSLINKFWQYIYIRLIQIRLWIMKEPYIYIILNFMITYWLIINQYLIVASIISIIVLMSRVAIHASDYTIQELREIINFVEKMEVDETPEATYVNAEIIAIITTRSFDDRKFHEYIQENLKKANCFEDREFASRSLMISNVVEKYVQLYPNYLNDPTDGIIYKDDIFYQGRILNPGKYKRILKITKINSYLYKPFLISVGPIEILKNSKIIKKKILIAPENRVSAYQSAENPFKYPETSRLQIQQINKPIHPTILLNNKNNNFSGVSNTSTMRDLEHFIPAAVKLVLQNDSRYGIVKLGQRETRLSSEEADQFWASIEKGVKNKTLVELVIAEDYSPLFVDANLPWDSDRFLMQYKIHMTTPSRLITVDSVLVRDAFLNSNCTAEQGIQAIEACLEHYTLLYEKADNAIQKKVGLKELQMTQNVLAYRKNNMSFFKGDVEDPFVKVNLDQLLLVNDNLKKELNEENLYRNLQNSVSEMLDMPVKEAKERHITNYKRIPEYQQIE